jgi:hypothetical protein
LIAKNIADIKNITKLVAERKLDLMEKSDVILAE